MLIRCTILDALLLRDVLRGTHYVCGQAITYNIITTTTAARVTSLGLMKPRNCILSGEYADEHTSMNIRSLGFI